VAGERSRSDEVKGFTTRGTAWEWRASWFLLFFLTYFLYWVPLAYMGLRVLQFRWIVYAVFYAGPAALLVLCLSYLRGVPDFAGVIRYLWYSTSAFWVFALIHTWAAREEFLLRLDESEEERDEIRSRIRARRELDGAESAPPPSPRRLLDVNGASEAELAMLPGMGPERARQALQLRAQHGGFRSFSHFAEQLQLAPEARARLQQCFDDDPEPPKAPQDPAYRVMPDGQRLLELNWAGAETIGALPGLGPELGRRAILLRESDGPYKSIEDFRYRLGLPVDAIVKISPYVSVISMSTTPAGGADKKTGGRIVDV
jgi:DNA uptake protein ComE-like DNA-binding protein